MSSSVLDFALILALLGGAVTTMSRSCWTHGMIALFLTISTANAQDVNAADPLFQSDDTLDVKITAPMSTLIKKRPVEEELPATLEYVNAAGEIVVLDMNVRTRGKFRLRKDICAFPPLRLNFKKKQTKGTLFHKQDKLKLVTHCQASSIYEKTTLREYIAYRTLNTITDNSFRVRLLRITYVDSEARRRDKVAYGFVIEHRDRLSKRLDRAYANIPGTEVSALDLEYMNLISMYHYLIGNTDYSQIKSAPNEACCHNHVLFGNDGDPYWSIPYDFDQSGIVNARHASPNERFRLRNVRDRLYRGRCVNNGELAATISIYQQKRPALLALVATVTELDSRAQRRVTDYIDSFYKVLGSDKKIQSEFVKKCL